MWYTPTLRPNDSGMLWVGIDTNPLREFIPHGIVSTSTGFCPSDCTEFGFPRKGITAFASFLHAHTTAVAMSLRHIRDGVELEPLDVNRHYDFDYQQSTILHEERTLLPGDQFIVECTYDTTDRDKMVLSGLGTSLVFDFHSFSV